MADTPSTQTSNEEWEELTARKLGLEHTAHLIRIAGRSSDVTGILTVVQFERQLEQQSGGRRWGPEQVKLGLLVFDEPFPITISPFDKVFVKRSNKA